MSTLETIVSEEDYREALLAELSHKSGVALSQIDGSTETFGAKASGGLGFSAAAGQNPMPSIYEVVAKKLLGKTYTSYHLSGPDAPNGAPDVDAVFDEGFRWICKFGVRAGIDVIQEALHDNTLDFPDQLGFTGGVSALTFPSAVENQINARMRATSRHPKFKFTSLEQANMRSSNLVRDAYNVFISIALR